MAEHGTTSEQDLRPTVIRLTTHHRNKVRELADKRGLSVAGFIRHLIEKAK